MSDVFLDTVGMIAVWNKADQWHTEAEAAYQDLLQHARRLLTTPSLQIESPADDHPASFPDREDRRPVPEHSADKKECLPLKHI